jgi:hypothetical protein
VLSLGLGGDIGLLLIVILLDGLLLLGSLGGLLSLGGIGLLLSLGLGVLFGSLVLGSSLNVLPLSEDLGELGALDDATKNKASQLMPLIVGTAHRAHVSMCRTTLLYLDLMALSS